MEIEKSLEDWIYDYINDELRFLPSCDPDSPFLPFSINRKFEVFDISQMTDDQINLLYELAPQALCNCLQPNYLLYAVDWFHNYILYDPRRPENAQSSYPVAPSYTKTGIAYYLGFYPDGDYYFFIDRYGSFGYLSHPWRDEVWIFGEPLLDEFDKIYDQLGWIKKASLL